MVQEFTYGRSVPGEVIEVSSEGLRAMLGQVEADLYHSETYGQVLSNLQTLPADLSHQVQRMVKAIGREAIRLAFRRLMQKKSITADTNEIPTAMPQSSREQPTRSHFFPPPPPANSALQESSIGSAVESMELVEPVESAVLQGANDQNSTEQNSTGHRSSQGSGGVVVAFPVPPAVMPVSCPSSQFSQPPQSKSPQSAVKKPRKRLSKKELAAQAAIQAWQDQLRELGQEIRQLRQARSLSLYQLHSRTQIPIHQLEALENGNIERLPEDIYIRGFLRRIGQALCVDGVALANSLPAIDPVKAILPTWYKPQALKSGGPGLHLTPVHLYVGYAALLAGGLTWLSHQSAPKEPVVPPAPAPAPTTANPPAKATQSQTTAPTAIAMPEMIPNG